MKIKRNQPVLGSQRTLDQWALQTGNTVEVHATSGCKYVVTSLPNADYLGLWNLLDYVVSSIGGPVLWLAPRRGVLENL